ncbi:PP0621 family protein [Sulfurimonas sp.]
MKLLLIAAVIAVIYFMFIKKTPLQATKSSKKKETKPEANDMVECANCALYIEVNESILSNGKYFCSKECVAEFEAK